MQQYNFPDLQAFVAVVQTGHFKQAADQLDISTATVSRRVAALEQALDTRLFNRTTRQIHLTEAGQRYYADICTILQLTEEAEERLRHGRETLQGTLRVAAPLSFGLRCLAPLLPGFMQAHPQLSVQLELDDRFTNLVSEGMDVAIRIGILQDSTLVATPIGQVRRVFCAAPAYLQQKGEPTTPVELIAHNCLHFSLLNTLEEWCFLRDGQTQSIAVAGSLTTNNGEVLLEAAMHGLGIAMLPDFIVAEALQAGRLRAILCDWEPEPFGIYLLRPSRAFTPARIQAFIDYLRTASLPGWGKEAMVTPER